MSRRLGQLISHALSPQLFRCVFQAALYTELVFYYSFGYIDY